MVHLDLNLGNLLADPQGWGISIIDFEFGPVDWVTLPQQMAFDYLRLIDDALKPRRGGRSLLAEPQRLASLLESCVAPSARRATCNSRSPSFSDWPSRRSSGEP